MQEPQSKVCRECQIEKDIEAFAPNQYGKNNRVLKDQSVESFMRRKSKPTHNKRETLLLNTQSLRLERYLIAQFV